MVMGKKNPYVMTIGFNKEDPEHRRAAGLLNDMGRGKASYIAKAILAYETIRESGEFSSTRIGIDYESLRNFVLKVIAEHEVKCGITLMPVENEETESNLKKEDNLIDQIGFDQAAIQDILISMEAFRS